MLAACRYGPRQPLSIKRAYPVGLAGGRFYFAGALVLGVLYVAAAARFWRDASDLGARRLLRTSFVYLPAILLLLLLNPPAA